MVSHSGFKEVSVCYFSLLSHVCDVSVFFQDCIPAYTLGHADKLSQIESFLHSSGLPLQLIGSSYRGVSVNDCINNARIEAETLLGRL